MNRVRVSRLVLMVGLLTSPVAGLAVAGDDAKATWDPKAAAKALDERATAWIRFGDAQRGQGATKTSCISCHSVVPFALARAELRRVTKEETPSEPEAKILDQIRLRVANWGRVESKEVGLLYEFSPSKKRESRGTESVLNALVLAANDRAARLDRPSLATSKALQVMWSTQVDKGDEAGSWEWLLFGLEPWESSDARYHGAALAARAVATAPGYLAGTTDPAVIKGVERLKGYLRRGAEGQDLYNRVAVLRASGSFPGLLKPDERDALVAELRASQAKDGGWSLAGLGSYERSDGTPEESGADGYATGLVVDALRAAGLPGDDPAVRGGMDWLRGHQRPGGTWDAHSLNKKRDPSTNVGKFMTDAATGQAVLALVEGEASGSVSDLGRAAPGPGRPSVGTAGSR